MALAQETSSKLPIAEDLPPATTLAGAPANGTHEWNGQSGASAHPLMTAEAISAAAAQFGNCIAGARHEAAQRGVTPANFERYTAGLTPDLSIMEFLDSQAEFIESIWDYLDTQVSDERIERGRELLMQYASVFAAVERAYGVDRHIIAAIWGIESDYSTFVGDRPVVRSTATLACVGRRREYFREEFLSALEILQRGDVAPERLVGSWAGAFGPTQFTPSSFKRFAVDFDGDGRRDVVDSIPDVIASTANKLRLDGWASEQTWGYEIVVPPNFDYLLTDPSKEMTVGQWNSLGITRAGESNFPRLSDRAFLLLPAGARGPGFLMLPNFHVITKYNPSEAYALAVGLLADRLRGSGPLVHAWPREERALTIAECYELQQPSGTARFRGRRARRHHRAANARSHPELPDHGRAGAGWFRD